MTRRLAAVAVFFGVLFPAPSRRRAGPPTPTPPSKAVASIGCVDCHLALDDARVSPPAKLFADDIHARSGFTCASCHGGDPRAEDQDVAHDPKKGFRGKPSPKDIPALCASCHSDAAAMKHFNPSERVDQLAEYRTSGHGKALLRGDESVATCVSCHGAHGILPVKDVRSPVYPTRVAETCNRCHGDATLMAAHKLPSDVYAKYSKSVHFEALMKKGDLSSPTCNSCHGNHGAAPPQVASVANVCGTCHTIFAEQFKASPHWEAFAELGLPGCVTCHENHDIVAPTDAFLSTGKDGKCVDCHETGTEGARSAAAMHEDIVTLEKQTSPRRPRSSARPRPGCSSPAPSSTFRAPTRRSRRRGPTSTCSSPTPCSRRRRAGSRSPARRSAQAVLLRHERDFRRKGLVVALLLIGISIAALVAKIRDIDRRKSPRSGS